MQLSIQEALPPSPALAWQCSWSGCLGWMGSLSRRPVSTFHTNFWMQINIWNAWHKKVGSYAGYHREGETLAVPAQGINFSHAHRALTTGKCRVRGRPHLSSEARSTFS
jgi:hypothetical protein